MDKELIKKITKIALQNAYEHGGKTQDKIILGKILGSSPEYRSKVKEISKDISEIVNSINQLSAEEQGKKINKSFPELLATKEKIEEREGLPELKGAVQGKVVTRFPPEPNGYPHIGHAKAAIINSEYAKMYGGKFILRMDDTNPEAERMEYHAAIKVGLEWLGVKFDLVKNTSDDMKVFYEKGLELINSGKAYVCTCKREDISKNRRERKSCKCSMADINQNNKNWEKMNTKYKSGEAIVRFRGDMKADNAVMRDPVLFRIIDEKHYTLGEKFRIWPSYDMAVAIEDSIDGVTHAFRSKEFELRKELIDEILDALKMRKPEQGFFSRLEFKGMPISKRIIKPLIDEGKVSWYDDPRLPTLEALRRRGIKPEAIRKFVMSLGLTKANTLAPFDALEAFNRKFVDAESIRLFMVSDAKKLVVKNLSMSSIEISNHPINNMGKRKIEIDENFYIAGDDAKNFKEGTKVRLLGLGNVLIKKTGAEFEGELIDGGDTKEITKIQWVPQKTAHKIKMIVPKALFIGDEFNEDSLEELDVYTEPQYLQLKEGEEIQFIRFGYCRKDSQNQSIFTHK
ncbi:MAG: glutamate--tRNA ligase [Nitrosopumilus sp.]|nr:glutamate--tRNA ligase [Nitrosopumilus sp.]